MRLDMLIVGINLKVRKMQVEQTETGYQYTRQLTFDEAKTLHSSTEGAVCISFIKTIQVEVAFIMDEKGIDIKLNPQVGERPWVDLEFTADVPADESTTSETLEAFGIDRQDKIWTFESQSE